MPRADIRYSIEYLQELKAQIESATAKALTEEQARDQIVMARFAAYSLYERIHLGVNVPTLLAAAGS
jgi:cyclase